MSTLFDPNRQIDLLPFVEEAIKRLGIFRIDAAPWLALKISEYQDQGKTAYQIRREEPQLSPADKKSAGIRGNVKMSVAMWNALSVEGRADPVHAPEVVCRRAAFNARKALRHASLSENSDLFQKVEINFVASRCCYAAKSLKGSKFNIPNMPHLPLAACSEDICHCDWEWSRETRLQSNSVSLRVQASKIERDEFSSFGILRTCAVLLGFALFISWLIF